MIFGTEFFHFSFEITLSVILFHFVSPLFIPFFSWTIVQYTALHGFDVANGLLGNQAHTINMVYSEHLLGWFIDKIMELKILNCKVWDTDKIQFLLDLQIITLYQIEPEIWQETPQLWYMQVCLHVIRTAVGQWPTNPDLSLHWANIGWLSIFFFVLF